VSIRIPSSKVAGAVGKHSVLVTEVGDDFVTYFDSDELVTDRYGVDAPEQMIERVDSDALIYTQPKDTFFFHAWVAKLCTFILQTSYACSI
jgi:hypothetical protein